MFAFALASYCNNKEDEAQKNHPQRDEEFDNLAISFSGAEERRTDRTWR